MTVLKIGSKLQSGKYEITRVLGSGNFGITYLASTKIAVKGQMGQMDVTINVAIKEFYMKDLNNRTLDGTTVEGTQNTMVKNYRHKFRKEAENLAKLHHPNIIKVIEVFDENNTTYYVMEYIEGGSLDDYIKQKGHLSEDEALRCTIEIGKALSYMHKNRMIHLDLKPKNVMRNPNGILFLIDFGLSKQYDENGEPESSTSIGLGTPGYAPLEQANYKQDGTLPVTIDVYSLGATFFKMLTGKTPPEASSVLNEGLPLKALKHTGVSAGTISIVEKAMSPMKKERYQTVSSMSEAISTLSDGNEQTIYEQEKESLKYNEEAEVKVENSIIENSINHKIGVNSNIPWKRKIGGVKIAQMTGLGIVVLLVLLCTINNAPLEIGYHIGSNIWNIGIVGLCSSILFRIYYIFTKKKIWGLISIVGLILSLIFLFFLFLIFSKKYSAEFKTNINDEIVMVEMRTIDLGLPSGTLWASCNLGAKSEQADGEHYAFGTTESKNDYPENTGNQYNDGASIIGTSNDVASIKLGSEWQLPSKEQMEELVENCRFVVKSNGYDVIGPNGNTIFLPYTRGNGNIGYYWSGNKGYVLEFQPGYKKLNDNDNAELVSNFATYCGLSIRPVKK